MVGNGISSTKGKASLHSRYFPGEWGYATCKAVFQRADNDLASKSRVFGEICKRHSPCFRFFFMENFGNNSSQAWFGSKQRYARSVAVSSVVGHILGIGDRHGSNILVCHGPKGGELVHIDFGIVFEQGRELNTPERVPFRLTQNVIDGLGPTGTNGMFTKACEETMAVLKHNTASLLTILSAIVSDPLYQWTVSAAKAREIQREEDEEPTIMSSNGKSRSRHAEGANKLEQNEAAMQTISRIQQKLQGYEDGTSGEQQSIESQIQLLINSARDPDNLCQMFEGWAPWV